LPPRVRFAAAFGAVPPFRPLRCRVPAGAFRAPEPHHELAEALGVHLDAHAHDLSSGMQLPGNFASGSNGVAGHPKVAVADDLVPVGDKGTGERGVPLGRLGDRQEAYLDPEVAEEAQEAITEMTRGQGADSAILTVDLMTADVVAAGFNAIGKGGVVVVTVLNARFSSQNVVQDRDPGAYYMLVASGCSWRVEIRQST